MDPETDEAAFDRRAALALLGGDEQLLTEVLDLFLREGERMLETLRSSLAQGDPAGVQRSAHALKGALLNISAGPASRAAAELEQAGRQAAAGRYPALLLELEGELQRLRRELTGRRAP